MKNFKIFVIGSISKLDYLKRIPKNYNCAGDYFTYDSVEMSPNKYIYNKSDRFCCN